MLQILLIAILFAFANAEEGLQVYSDGLNPAFSSWSSVDFANTAVVHSGSKSIKYTPSGSYAVCLNILIYYCLFIL